MEILLNNEMFVTITGILLFFVISIIINIIDNYYRKITKKPIYPNTTLNCGIWAWAGKNPKKFNKSKFDMLGLFNDSRGGQGCGIYKNGEIIKSSSHKLYKDFLISSNYNNDLENPVIFGHARKSSSGIVNDNNTHPFGFGELKNKEYEFAGVHNGTLYNERELSTMFKSDYSKIDSHILLESIYKNKNFKVLNHYIGAAAIVFVNNNEPNTIYAFRGESKKYEYSKEVEDERPLYYYQESVNSLYISSMMESLIAITEVETDIEKICEFEPNKVYKIVDGNIDKAKLTNISRKECFQRESYSNSWGGGCSSYNFTNSRIGNKSKTFSNKSSDKKVKKIDLNSKVSTKKNDKFDINKESLKRVKGEGDKIKFEKLKYCRNGHPVTGVFFYTLNDEFIFLDEDYVDAAQEFYQNYVNHYFDLDTNKFVKTLAELNSDNFYMPFPLDIVNDSSELPLVYIVKGHRVMTRRDYEVCYNNKSIDSYNLQFCSFYPVIINKQAMIKGQKVLHDRINALGSKFIYTIVDGKVVSRKNINSVGLLKSINSTCDIKEANIAYLKDINKLFDNTSNDIKFKRSDHNKRYSGLFGQYLEDLETDEGPALDTIFNLPAQDCEIYEEKADVIEKHLIEELNDNEYETKEEKRTINYVSKNLNKFSNKYLLKKVDVLKQLSNSNKAKKLVNITETFINSIEEFNKNETDNIVKNL